MRRADAPHLAEPGVGRHQCTGRESADRLENEGQHVLCAEFADGFVEVLCCLHRGVLGRGAGR